MKELLPYYERELVLLRRHGREFAARSATKSSCANANSMRFTEMEGKGQLWRNAENIQLTEIERARTSAGAVWNISASPKIQGRHDDGNRGRHSYVDRSRPGKTDGDGESKYFFPRYTSQR